MNEQRLILQSGDHIISETNVYIALPHLNGHVRIGFYNRTKHELVNGGSGLSIPCTEQDICKFLKEDKIVTIQAQEVYHNHTSWNDAFADAHEELRGGK